MNASGDFRNPNGVYMKMMNFRRFDPEYTRQGRVGLTRGNKGEGLVWDEFAGDKPRLAKVAAAIRLPSSNATVQSWRSFRQTMMAWKHPKVVC